MANADGIVGMGKRQAQNAAELRNLAFRLVSVDDEEMLGWPTDGKRDDRICCVVKDGKVVQAEIR